MCSALGIPGTENILLNISETTSYFCEKIIRIILRQLSSREIITLGQCAFMFHVAHAKVMSDNQTSKFDL